MSKLGKKVEKKGSVNVDYKSKILNLVIQEGDVTQGELRKIPSIPRQDLAYNLRALCRDGQIEPYITFTAVKAALAPLDDELHYKLSHKKATFPQNFSKLLDDVYSLDKDIRSHAVEEFNAVYKEYLENLVSTGMLENYTAEYVLYRLTPEKVKVLKELLDPQLLLHRLEASRVSAEIKQYEAKIPAVIKALMESEKGRYLLQNSAHDLPQYLCSSVSC
jgi:hypothetical protein